MKSLILSVLCAAFLAGAGQAAQGFLYDCDMIDTGRERGWISPKIAVVFPKDGTVRVVDAITLYFVKDAVQGRILQDNDARVVVRWSIPRARTDTGVSFNAFDYRASIAKRTGRIDVTAKPRSYDTGVTSRGTCVRRTQ